MGHLLHKINPVALMQGVVDDGGVAVTGCMSAPRTLATMEHAGLNLTQLWNVGQSLRDFLGAPVFATKQDCASYVNPHANTLIHGIFGYFDDTGVYVKVNWWHSDPVDVFTNCLRSMCDSKQSTPIGPKVGELGECITMSLSGDHGGISMKMVMTICAREGDGQKFTFPVGVISHKESWSIRRRSS
jgi:hypothetical protein